MPRPGKIIRPSASPMWHDIRCWCPVPTAASSATPGRCSRNTELSLEPIGECDSLNTMRELVAAGVANSIMTWSGLHGGAPRIALNYRRFADAKMVRPVSLCFSEVSLRSPAIDAVALTLKSLVRELVESGAWQGVTLIAPAAEPSGSAGPPWRR